jgi:hypothetical protein
MNKNKNLKISKKLLAYGVAVCMAEICFSKSIITARSKLVDEMAKDIRRLLRNNTIYTEGLLDVPERAMRKLNSVMYKRVFKRSPWVKLVRRGSFPKGMGSTIRELSYEGFTKPQADGWCHERTH